MKIATEGDFSPIVNGNGNLILTSLSHGITREIHSILTVIKLVSKLARDSAGEEEVDQHTKDLETKLNVRFKQYLSEIKREYLDLHTRYAQAYLEISRVNNIDSLLAEEMAKYLKRISKKHLTEEGPIVGLDSLTDFFVNQIPPMEIEISEGAIRYYLLKELINCNVFPNPSENEDEK